ncbi:MAG: hypothetical protein AB8D52_01980 [Gammaproteobacteria bacterium]
MKKSHISLGAVAGIALLVASCAGGSGSTMSNMSSAEIAAMKGQTTGVDSQGNVVELGEFFTYGGDNSAAYNEGILATGAKDPAVCGTFSEAKCSVGHLE